MDKYRIFYQKYKGILIPIVFLLASLFIALQIAYPNIETISQLHTQISDEEKKLQVIKNSYGVVNSVDENTLNDQVSIATKALPNSKSPSDIYLAVVSAATNANASLKSFSVNVGSLLSPKEGAEVNTPTNVSVKASFTGMNVNSFQVFMESLMKEAPISVIRNAEISKESGEISVDFFYKGYDLTYINSENIGNLTPAEKNTLKAITF